MSPADPEVGPEFTATVGKGASEPEGRAIPAVFNVTPQPFHQASLPQKPLESLVVGLVPSPPSAPPVSAGLGPLRDEDLH